MNYCIDIQNCAPIKPPFTKAELVELSEYVLQNQIPRAELTLRLVSEEEITKLNTDYRKIAKKTNVLAFPADLPEAVLLDYPFLGDVVLCPEVLQEESLLLQKDLKAHWVLIVTHGILHLLGYDHIKDEDAQRMQDLERHLLKQLGYPDPYETEQLKDDTLE